MENLTALQQLPDVGGVPAAQEDKVFNEIKRLIQEGVQKLGKAAELIGRLTREQRRKFSAQCPLLNRGYIENLALLGQKIMAPHIALKPKSIRAGLFLRLPEEARKRLNDPSYPIDIWMGHGKVRTKMSGECTGFELCQVIDVKKGILTAEDQAKRALPPPVPKAKKGEEDIEENESITLLDKQWVIFVGKRGGKQKVLLRNLRKRFAVEVQ